MKFIFYGHFSELSIKVSFWNTSTHAILQLVGAYYSIQYTTCVAYACIRGRKFVLCFFFKIVYCSQFLKHFNRRQKCSSIKLYSNTISQIELLCIYIYICGLGCRSLAIRLCDNILIHFDPYE